MIAAISFAIYTLAAALLATTTTTIQIAAAHPLLNAPLTYCDTRCGTVAANPTTAAASSDVPKFRVIFR